MHDARTRFPFRFDPAYQRLARLFGVTPERAWVKVGNGQLEARFGPWRLRTPTENVASVEVRTNLFSIDVPRRRYGDFIFELRVFDVPPIFVRAYRVRVIARNSAGVQAEEDFPLRIR